MEKFSMDDEPYQEIQNWLFKSQRDLESAKVLLEHQFFDAVVYHYQQSAEKALKAYLVYQQVTLAEVLSPYATEFRYPSDIVEPDISEAEQAWTMTEAETATRISRVAA
ncbi:MAG: HEPN domain-containing protein [Pseudanabaenaceae cyanobacterium bins.39]|nr:HEPN domain-containing protein [Pseudanabaenaceae cyanobacterium bins.39]